MKNYKLKINGNDYNVDINEVEGQEIKLSVNGTEYVVNRRAHDAPLGAACHYRAGGDEDEKISFHGYTLYYIYGNVV